MSVTYFLISMYGDDVILSPLITTSIVFNLFYSLNKSPILETKCVFKHKDLQKIDLKVNTYMSNFHSLEVVGRGSETQLQVGENLNKLT